MSYKSVDREKLEEIALGIRSQMGALDGYRLRIEEVLDSRGYSLLAIPNLTEELGIDAYLPKMAKTIIVDKAQMDGGAPRYLFTLAHEFAHILIHLDGKNVEGVYSWIQGLTHSQYADLESDANYLAGAMLMPRQQFTQDFARYRELQTKALGKAMDTNTVIRCAIRKAYMAYGVSFAAAAYRARTLKLITAAEFHDIEKYKPTAFSFPLSIRVK